MTTDLIWNQIGFFFAETVFGNYLIAGIFFIFFIGLILKLAKTSWDTVFLFSIFITFGLVTSGIFGGLIAKSSFILMVMFAGYKYFTYILKLVGQFL